MQNTTNLETYPKDDQHQRAVIIDSKRKCMKMKDNKDHITSWLRSIIGGELAFADLSQILQFLRNIFLSNDVDSHIDDFFFPSQLVKVFTALTKVLEINFGTESYTVWNHALGIMACLSSNSCPDITTSWR